MKTSRKNKNVLITGGSRGIGAEAVRQFAAEGSSVAFLYKSSNQKALELSKATGALNIKCNVANSPSVEAAMDVANEFFEGQLDVLICNAGISDFGLFTDFDEDRWSNMIETNLNGVYRCVRAVLPGMISRKKGSIIIVSSMWGQVGASCEVAYSTAKAGLIGMTKALAKEEGPSGIRVNCICPGLIDTDMNANVSKAAQEDIIYDTPLSRIGTPADVVKVMKFLASDQSSFVTGQIMGVNGGLIM